MQEVFVFFFCQRERQRKRERICGKLRVGSTISLQGFLENAFCAEQSALLFVSSFPLFILFSFSFFNFLLESFIYYFFIIIFFFCPSYLKRDNGVRKRVNKRVFFINQNKYINKFMTTDWPPFYLYIITKVIMRKTNTTLQSVASDSHALIWTHLICAYCVVHIGCDSAAWHRIRV